ncbi:hypothetical protein MMYC01_200262 [Madurella mycetomatis]|uniref:Uncharacterized protein n=1 Tax=Madurella mycetomatis TaxID=100816 RepID=A0A175WHP7_9PEZI|nr:hypothetical protein MMYC01_200262 [Madurella mycetomatis]
MPEFIVINENQPQRSAGAANATAAPLPPQGYLQQPQYAAPYVQHPNPTVKICDLREAQPPTSEAAREMLSEYFVYRFTKAEDNGGYSSDGEPLKPSWKRVKRVSVPGISKQEAAKTVRELNRDTIPVARKRSTLSDDEQRQIEMALEELQRSDNQWFQTTLVQLDDQVKIKDTDRDNDRERERERGRGREREKDRDRRSSRHPKEYHIFFGEKRSSSKRPTSKAREPKKRPSTERVSITAYYKRSPRLDVDPFAILQYRAVQEAQREAQREAQLRAHQANAQQANRPNEEQHPSKPGPAQGKNPTSPAAAARARSPGDGRGKDAQVQAKGKPTITTIQPTAPRPAAVKEHEHRPRRQSSPRPSYRGPPSTDSSTFSDTFSTADDTSATSPSSDSHVPNHQASYERLRPKKPQGGGGTRFMESPLHFGIPPNLSPAPGVYALPQRPGLHRRRNSVSHHQSSSRNPPAQGTFFPSTAALPIPPSPPASPRVPTMKATDDPRANPLSYDTVQQMTNNAYAKGREEATYMTERIARAVVEATAAAATATVKREPSPPPLLLSRHKPHVVQPHYPSAVEREGMPLRGGLRILRGADHRDQDWERDRDREEAGMWADRTYRHYRYERPRVRDGLDDLRLHLDPEDDEEEELYEERGVRGSGRYTYVPRREREYGMGGVRRREMESDKWAREEEQDLGIDVGIGVAAAGPSRPFAPRPGLGARTSYTRRHYDD